MKSELIFVLTKVFASNVYTSVNFVDADNTSVKATEDAKHHEAEFTASFFLQTDYNNCENYTDQFYNLKLKNKYPNNPTNIHLHNVTMKNTNLSSEGTGLHIIFSSFDNTFLSVSTFGRPQDLFLSDSSFVTVSKEEEITGISSFIWLNGDWNLVSISKSQFCTPDTASNLVVGVFASNGNIQQLLITGCEFRNMLGGLVSKNIVHNMQIIFTAYVGVWQALNLGHAKITRISLHNCKITGIGTKVRPRPDVVISIGNLATQYSTVLNVTQSNISISNCIFTDNTLSIANISQNSDTHGILVISGSTMNVFECQFMGNTGGCFSLVNSEVSVLSSSFQENAAELNQTVSLCSVTLGYDNITGLCGGVMLTSSSVISVVASNFTSNSAHSGGVFFLANRSTITVWKSQFVSNQAKHSGAVILAKDSSNVQVKLLCVFDRNQARKYGGVMLAMNNVTVNVNLSSFTNNRANLDGGVVEADGDSSVLVESFRFPG